MRAASPAKSPSVAHETAQIAGTPIEDMEQISARAHSTCGRRPCAARALTVI
jgi:hypothetical protein